MSRCFIVDPVCGFDYGHNPHQLTYMVEYFSARGFETYGCCARSYPEEAAKKKNFNRDFWFYYEKYIPLKERETVPESEILQTQAILEEFTKLEDSLLPSDNLEALAIADWLMFFEKWDITTEDRIFFPSVDFYGMVGILKALRLRFNGYDIPYVHFRFIGVMETATPTHENPLRILRFLTRKYIESSRIEMSAESEVYAKFLCSFFDCPVTSTFIPLKSSPLPIRENGQFLVYAGGAGRLDKGFFETLNIAQKYIEKYPNEDVQFVVQKLKWDEEKIFPYEMSQMYAAPNITVLPTILTSEEMEQQYAECHLILAPYDFEIYKFRGSAMTQEGVVKARPILLMAMTGFHYLASRIPNIHNCCSPEDFADMIHYYYTMDRKKLYNEACKSAKIFEEIASGSMHNVMESDTVPLVPYKQKDSNVADNSSNNTKNDNPKATVT